VNRGDSFPLAIGSLPVNATQLVQELAISFEDPTSEEQVRRFAKTFLS
jgi:hypothetical protein